MTKAAVLPDLSGQDFLSLYKREANARGKIRLLALHHLQQGKQIQEVGQILCITRKTIYSWLLWYQNSGIDRLLSKTQGRGCKKLVQLPKEEIQAGIEKLQEDRGGGRIIGEDIIEWIYQTYGVRYSKGHIYNLLHSLGLSWVTVRSRHPKQNIKIQEEFKKNLSQS
jgi:transposase